ncbi:hypothetical protein [Agrobacterium tumefaciens]|uniref:hypothetical protein n=1 Tax=Agrobacterium tumefaciens TaxID=358 RepID=UPI001572872E|nr:hypothetical protein [Agrobacterium tumefaciens]MEA1842779.1 hypothetical protein [Agrobacterium tumefaciens]WCK20085.1 hypothetical protein G6M09_013545 [Agrobacterium tumefaciens]
MTGSPLVNAIQKRLRHGGYDDVSTPFKVAGVEFRFTGAMRGRGGRALDLVILVDTTTGDFGDRDGTLVRQRVEALSRALDVTASRYVITVILAGAVLAEGIEILSETCRVLQVESVALNDEGDPADEKAERWLDDRIRVLLPLTLPTLSSDAQKDGGSTMDQLARALPSTTQKILVDALIAASSGGEEAVTEAAALIINQALHVETGADPS